MIGDGMTGLVTTGLVMSAVMLRGLAMPALMTDDQLVATPAMIRPVRTGRVVTGPVVSRRRSRGPVAAPLIRRIGPSGGGVVRRWVTSPGGGC